MTIVVCVCGQKNRVPPLRPTQRVRCGRCKAALLVSGHDDLHWTPNPDLQVGNDDEENDDEQA
jgi:hypothetical protein